MRGVSITFRERKEIENLCKVPKISASQIARLMNRPKNTIVTEIRRAGGLSKYTAEMGQQRAIEGEIQKREKLVIRNKGNKREFHLVKRVQNLEMQVDILIDKIRAMEA